MKSKDLKKKKNRYNTGPLMKIHVKIKRTGENRCLIEVRADLLRIF